MSHVCPAMLEIEGHSLQIIASDSYDLKPVTVNQLVSTAGERYDFVINGDRNEGKSKQLKIILKALDIYEQERITG